MIKNELKLYFKSKINLLMLIFMTLPVVLSYFATNNERLEWQEQLQGAAADLNLGKVREIVDGYSGISYIFNFLFSSDYFIIFFLITLMGFSCVFGAELYNKNKSGFGNLTVVRMGYSKYLNCTLLSQAIYIACFLFVYFLLLTLITTVIFPFEFSEKITCNFPLSDCGPTYCFWVFALQLILIVVIDVAILLITSLCNVIIDNKYVLHCIPLILYFIPYLLASTVGNISAGLGSILQYLVIDYSILALYFHKISENSIWDFLTELLFLPTALVVLTAVIYVKNKKRFARNYI